MQFGVSAVTAPGTGLLEEGSAVALAAAMFGATVVVVMIMLAIRPAMRRTSAQARVLARHVLAGSDPKSVGSRV